MSTNNIDYNPNFYLPAIEPPTNQTDPTTYYQGLNLNVNATPISNNGVKYTISRNNNDTSLFNHYLMTDGIIHFVISGATFPQNCGILSGTNCSQNTLLLKPTILSNQVFSENVKPGVPPPGLIIIENIDENTFIQSITAYINAAINGNNSYFLDDYYGYTPSIIMDWIDDTWLEINQTDPTQESLGDKIDLFVTQLMNINTHWFFLKGGNAIGKILNNTNDESEFSIKMLDSSMLEYIHPVASIKQIIRLPDEESGDIWTDNPLVDSILGFTIPIDIYLKFEIWNPLSIDENNPDPDEYIPIDAGCEVKIMDYDVFFLNKDNEVGNSLFTDSNGCVHVTFATWPQGADNEPDLYFKVINPSCAKIDSYNSGKNIDEQIVMPSEWSTKPNKFDTDYWLSVDETEGYLVDFQGYKLGTLAEPLTYRIGVDYHLKFTYLDLRDGDFKIFPKGISCFLLDERIITQYIPEENKKETTNAKGEIHGISFNLKPNKDYSTIVKFEIEDSGIGLNRCYIDKELLKVSYLWKSTSGGKDYKVISNNSKTSIGENTKPIEFHCEEEDRNTSVYVLKTVYEWAFFFYYMSQKQWESHPNIEININASGSMSFPLGHILLGKYDEPNWPLRYRNNAWNRGVIIHELSHTIMYQLINNIEFDLAVRTIWLNFTSWLHRTPTGHYFRMVTEQKFAFYEGWAEFIESLFMDLSDYNFLKSGLKTLMINSYSENDFAVTHLQPLPFGTGNYVEGTVCNSLNALFWKIITDFDSSINRTIIESDNGDLSSNNPWITSSLINYRFKNYVYDTMANITYSGSLNFVFFEAILAKLNIQDKNLFRGDLYSWNTQYYNGCLNDPKISSLDPIDGFGYTSNQIIQINGEFFIDVITKYMDHDSLNIRLIVLFDNIEYDESINNSTGYYFDNGILKFRRPRLDVLTDTSVKVKIRIYIYHELIESNEKTFLLKQ